MSPKSLGYNSWRDAIALLSLYPDTTERGRRIVSVRVLYTFVDTYE